MATYKYWSRDWTDDEDDGPDSDNDAEWTVCVRDDLRSERYTVAINEWDDDLRGPGWGWTCSCPAWRRANRLVRSKIVDCKHIRMIKRTEDEVHVNAMLAHTESLAEGAAIAMENAGFFVCDDCTTILTRMGAAHPCMNFSGDSVNIPAQSIKFRLVSRKKKGEVKAVPVVEHVLLVQPVKRVFALRPRSGVPHG